MKTNTSTNHSRYFDHVITSFLHEIEHVLSVTGISYRKNSVPDCITDATETGTIFPVTVFVSGFWYVCHGPYRPDVLPAASSTASNHWSQLRKLITNEGQTVVIHSSSSFTSAQPSIRSFIISLVAWSSGRTSVFGRHAFAVLRSTCSWWVTTYVGKPSAIGRPTRPTSPFILSGSINE